MPDSVLLEARLAQRMVRHRHRNKILVESDIHHNPTSPLCIKVEVEVPMSFLQDPRMRVRHEHVAG